MCQRSRLSEEGLTKPLTYWSTTEPDFKQCMLKLDQVEMFHIVDVRTLKSFCPKIILGQH
jgi:hypothetical protein